MININKRMEGLGKAPSVIRNLFEYGNKRRAEIGAENVFDYSLGNPSVAAPDSVKNSIVSLANDMDPVMLHGYTSAVGDNGVRKAVADNINERYNAGVKAEDIYMTCGAAASLTVSINALVNEGDEIVAIAPFFPEYRVFVETAGAKLVVAMSDTKTFKLDKASLENAITEKTKAVIINSPNNPTGVILDRESIEALCAILKQKSDEYGHVIYLISDEPYRELVYDDTEIPYLINEYDNTLVCYSFSKSLSLPGERIGYIVVSNKAENNRDVFAAVCGAGRALGFVCAPSMMQRVIKDSLGKTADIEIYKKNRDLLYNSLVKMGFECVHPDGAFYLFVKSPENDANAFSEKAKKYELLLVPSDSFGVTGYVRLAYCVSTAMIEKSLPAFEKLAKEYNM